MSLPRILMAFLFTFQVVGQEVVRTPEIEQFIEVPIEILKSFHGQEGEIVFFPINKETLGYGRYVGTREVNGKTNYYVDKITPLEGVAPGGSDGAGAKLSPGRGQVSPSDGPATIGGDDFTGGMAGPTLGGALGAGLQAGLAAGAMKAFYNSVIMTPSEERAIKRAAAELGAARAGHDQAVRDANKAYSGAQHAGAVAVSKVVQLASQIPEPLPQPETSASLMGSGYFSNDPLFRAKADPIRQQLDDAPIRRAIDPELKEIGGASLDAASEAWANGEFEVSETQLEIAKGIVDLLVGIDPITGTARAAYEVFTGKNMVTGVELATWERALAGTVFTASLVTAGAASSVAASVRASMGIMRHMASSGFKAGSLAMLQGQRFFASMRALNWSIPETIKFAQFQTNVLGPEIRNFEVAVEAYKTWSPAAKASYRKTLQAILGSSDEVAAEAARLGVSAEELVSRKATAVGFYNNTAGFRGNVRKISEHLGGIDFAENVAVVRVPAGTQIHAWSHIKAPGPGNYYAEKIMRPSSLGVGDFTIVKVPVSPGSMVKDKLIFTKELRTYQTSQEISVLKSRANEMHDQFSVAGMADLPFGDYYRYAKSGALPIKGMQYAQGLGEQLFLDPTTLRRLR